jgi:hypothetical protein
VHSVQTVAAIRAQLWDAGYRPVPVYNHDDPGPSPGKRPWGDQWQNSARREPPVAAVAAPLPGVLNTGILCDGLRPIDFDIDDPTIASRCRAIALSMFGEAPIRMRRDSPRCLVLYRAAEGMPRKRTLAGTLGKIEVLGYGNQFVAFGTHPDGAELEWFPDAPGQELLDNLPVITEANLDTFFDTCAPIINAEIKRTNGHDHHSSEPQADLLRVATALAQIPNNGPADWDAWNRVGMALWRATGGSAAGFALFDSWSQQHPAYDPIEVRNRWDHYPSSPPSQIGAGTLFFMAKEAEKKSKATIDEQGAEASQSVEQFPATPLDWDEMVSVKPREWVYGHFLIKRFVSALGAPGGTGKTAYAFTTALCVATGRELLGEQVHEPGNVWIYNLEDPKDELLRRFWAACRHHGVEKTEIIGRVFLDSGRDRPLVIASVVRDMLIASPVVPLLVEELKRRDIRLLIVDPFVRSHRLKENDNDHIDFAVSLWAEVADKANCCILLVHHFHKGGKSGEASAFRGASSLIDAGRAALTLAPMTEQESQRFGIDADHRWQYIRVDNAKLNLAPPPENALWLKLVGVDLENSKTDRPSDRVQTVEKWEQPSPWEGMPMSMVVRILDKIERGPEPGEFYAFSPQSKDRWAGHVLVDDAARADGQAKAILKSWKDSGLLIEGQYSSPKLKGRMTGCVRVDPVKLSEMRQQMNSAKFADE